MLQVQEIPYSLKYCQLIEQCLLAAEFRVFGDNTAVEFHKLCRGKMGHCSWLNITMCSKWRVKVQLQLPMC